MGVGGDEDVAVPLPGDGGDEQGSVVVGKFLPRRRVHGPEHVREDGAGEGLAVGKDAVGLTAARNVVGVAGKAHKVLLVHVAGIGAEALGALGTLRIYVQVYTFI